VETLPERKTNVLSALLIGTGAMIGTGLFVALGFAADVAGALLLPALAVAALVAAGTALSRASLGLAQPTGVGAYDYGYKYLNPGLGFTAGWAALLASTTAAAAAALGYSAYVMELLRRGEPGSAMTIAIGAVAGLTLLVLSGFRRSGVVNIVFTVGGMLGVLVFLVMMASRTDSSASQNLSLANASVRSPGEALAAAAALLFPAFAGFSQISKTEALLAGPKSTLLRTTLLAVVAAFMVYLLVSVVTLAVVGAPSFAQQTTKTLAPLATLADRYNARWVGQAVSGGAVLAMLGVALNLIVGSASLAKAMGQREDLPAFLSKTDSSETPYVATVVMGLAIGLVAAFTDLQKSWLFAAFGTLVYAALTNLAALKLDEKERMVPKLVPGLALLASVGLIVALPFEIWATGIVILLGGHVLRLLWVALRPAPKSA